MGQLALGPTSKRSTARGVTVTDTIRIFGVPMDLGQRRRGVDMGPSALRYAGLHQRLRALNYNVVDSGNLNVPLPENEPPDTSKARHLASIAGVCRDVYAKTLATLERNEAAM